MAQRAPSIAEQFKKQMAFGVAGDINDIDRIVEFIKNLYSELQGKFQTTKSYMNSLNSSLSSSSKIIGSNDIDNIIISVQDLIKNLNITASRSSITRRSLNALNTLAQDLTNLKNKIPSTEELRLFMNDNTLMAGNREELKDLFDLLEKMPKYSETMALIGKINQYFKSHNC